jgi:hypothetical protein
MKDSDLLELVIDVSYTSGYNVIDVFEFLITNGHMIEFLFKFADIVQVIVVYMSM